MKEDFQNCSMKEEQRDKGEDFSVNKCQDAFHYKFMPSIKNLNIDYIIWSHFIIEQNAYIPRYKVKLSVCFISYTKIIWNDLKSRNDILKF